MDLSDQNQSNEQSNQNFKQLYTLSEKSLRPLPKIIQQLKANPGMITQQTFQKLFKLPPQKKIAKEVCAKVFINSDLLVECYQCRFDSTCIICLECFKNGNHEGHKYVVRNASGGCCDCGDKQAWKQTSFCKQHTGKFKDFNIPQNILNETKQKLHQLFYLYFQFNLTLHPNRDKFNKLLLVFLQKLNLNKLYYNKLTSLCLCSPLIYNLNPILDACTVLQNILKIAISGQFIKTWFNLFMNMFGYYPFKMELIRVYIQKYGDIVAGQIGFSCGGTLSCQLMTSYQLVQKYCEKNNIALGQGSKKPSLKNNMSILNFRRYYIRLFYDLSYINKLKGTASLTYWKMHINSKEGLSNLFNYYDQICQYAKKLKMHGVSANNVMVQVVEMISIENQMISLFIGLVSQIKKKNDLMSKVIRFLWKNCFKYDETTYQATLFNTYERCLGIIFFVYINYNFQKIKQFKQKLSKQILNISLRQFQAKCGIIMRQLLKVYFINTKAISEPGFGQSIQLYLLYYKIKLHLLSSVDIVSLKLFLLLIGDKNSLLSLESLIKIDNLNNQLSVNTIKQRKVLVNSVIRFCKYLYTFSTSQIFLTYQIQPNQRLYQNQLSDFLFRFFVAHKNAVPIQKINLIISSFFSTKTTYINQWTNKYCQVNKQRKQFMLNAQFSNKQKQKGMNFNDIWQGNLAQNFVFSDPFKSKEAVEFCEYNRIIFQQIWNQNSLEKLTSIILRLYQSDSQGIQLLLSEILPIYLIKKAKNSEAKNVQILKQKILLPFNKKIPVEIRTKFPQLNPPKTQTQNQKITQQQTQLTRRKTKAQQLKQKKLQKMKQKQDKFINKIQIQQQEPILPKLKTKSCNKILEQEYIENCCICKNDNKEDLVYLVSVQIKNLQHMYKIGQGLNCLSFNSCLHAFDNKCLPTQSDTIHFDENSCPLCKISTQFRLPASIQKIDKKTALALIQKLSISILILNQQILKTMPNIQDSYVQTFYHFVILCYLDFRNFGSQKVKIYQILLQIWVKARKLQQLQKQQKQIYQEYQKNKIKQQKQIYKQKEILSPIQKQKIIHKTKHINKTRASHSKNLIQLKQTKQKVQQNIQIIKQNKISIPLFQLTACLFFKMVYAKLNKQRINENIFNQIRIAHLEIYNEQQMKFIYICLKKLFNQPISQFQIQFIQNIPRYPNLKVLNQLPLKYSDIGSKKRCTSCNQISDKLIMCLMCKWIGCQHCKQGQIQKHSLTHYGTVIFMNIQTSNAVYRSSQGLVYLGKLYQNVWGHTLYKNQKWDDFELNVNKIKQIQNNLALDRQISSLYKSIK